jgi:diguanylate cyclase (GGDEF)-like protein/PAS domain S-box-containing protein
MEDGFFRELLEILYDGVYYVDRHKRITYWNTAAEKITGYSRQEVMGRCCADNILRHIDAQGSELCLEGCPLSKTLSDGQVREVEVYLHHRNGQRVPVLLRVSPVRDADRHIVGAVEIFQDITRRQAVLKELEALKRDALIDPLTRVGNRKLGDMALQRCFEERRRYGVPFAILFLDIDHFKHFNDTYGHAVGDQVLEMVARTVANTLRSVDVVVRWGGEEFVVLLPNIDGQVLANVAERIRLFVCKSWISIDDRPVGVSVSVGGTLAGDPDTAESLVDRADRAMYASKTAGRNRVTLDLPPPVGGGL